jgi:hypothetical protein
MDAAHVITRKFVEERTREMFNTSPRARGYIKVGIYEFDLGFVVWPVEPEPADWSRPPPTIGGSVLVIDRETGEPSIWPRLSGPHVARLYRQARSGALDEEGRAPQA